MLTASQIADFRRDGFVHLPALVSTDLIENALHLINHPLGAGVPAAEVAKWRSQSFFPELARLAAITDLFNASGLHETLQSLMGAGNVPRMQSGQLALRFPREPGAPVRAPLPHIDGVHTPENGVPKGTLGSFSALVGVYLTDLDRTDAGNFTVWPGSHLRMQKYFRAHGTDVITVENRTPPIETGPPLQLQARAGDAVIAHYQLLHGAAGNWAPRPRYTIFFRVLHPEHEAHKMECLKDVWREWPGVQ